MPHVASVAGTIMLVAFFANLPLGLWRTSVEKYSIAWFLAVHLSVPFIVLARVKMELGLSYIPLFLGAAAAGQVLGGVAGNIITRMRR